MTDLKRFQVSITYYFMAENGNHAIEQFVDAVIHPDRQKAEIVSDIESAINSIETLEKGDTNG